MSDNPPTDHRDITPVTIEEEMRRSYLDYAMSVIVSRALPDVRDGLKPVHRRILYAMKEGGYDYNRPYRKSARIVGDVMGQYHPHGDAAIYDAMVRMAQNFSMRLPLVDGQGNFGSMDGDPPAAMRYTEARLARVASEALLEDIDRDTVDFQDNYDETTKEPTVLPARFPNLLINGAGGIAVGMATNVPPHNLGEVIDACCAYVDDPGIDVTGLMEHLPGPDFPTGALVVGRKGIRDAYHAGRGSVVMRARTHTEPARSDRTAIVVTEVPYQVNKARMVERIAELVRDKGIDGIVDLRDESDRDGLRVVIECHKHAQVDVVLNQLYRHTPLQTTFGVNMLALNGGRPEMLSLKDVIAAFVHFREEVITRRTAYELARARERAHILVGLAIAVANLDPVIKLIREAASPDEARQGLIAKAWPADAVAPLIAVIDEPGHRVAEDGTYRLSPEQAKAILDLRLHRLTGLEREKIEHELNEIVTKIQEYLAILGSRDKLMQVLRDELVEIKERYANPRRTELQEGEFEQDDEDLIPREEMVVTVSHNGYVKRVPLSAYRAQRRGGKGRSGMSTREEDFVDQVFVCDTHTPVLFFSSRGMVYKLKVYRLPTGTPASRGKPFVNLLPLEADETISICMPLPEDESTWEQMYVMFATASGNVRRNSLSDFVNVKANGKIAMKLNEGDRLVSVRVCGEEHDALLATAGGKAVRFPVTDVRVFRGRDSTGVRGVRLGKDDRVISMSILHHVDVTIEEREAYLRYATARRRTTEDEAPCTPQDVGIEIPSERIAELEEQEEMILSVADDGFGKLTPAYEYRVTNRGGQGIANMDLARNGVQREVVAAFSVDLGDQLMLVTDGGQLIRCPVEGIRVAGRNTRGVRLLRVADGERVVSVARLAERDIEAAAEDGDEGADAEGGSESVVENTVADTGNDGDGPVSGAAGEEPEDQE
ncbi:DNA gyrase subunit A [Ferruginivarius sediminum]|uniref:DNA gyrase subunit A n=1 Tax=Ferruginivarius sediminum TaxID=2661937 RepID=A0A369TAP2_9PROT|nr:DNA gyrase subunit A [Ferruginivarius sediminum]RDD61445.1 DNA gyrase subunit A [Ferruginivarius sediminum]